MIAYLPDIYPDELIYSWISRYHAHIGYPDEARTFMDLLDPLVQKVSHEFSVTFNAEMMARISSYFGDMAEFYHKHTLLDYYMIFQDDDSAITSLSRLLDGSHSVGLRAPMYAREYRMLRYCPRCAQEDRFLYGEAYYHVLHQIPDVNACLRHRCRLTKSCVRIHERQPVALIAAESIFPQDDTVVDADELEVHYAEYLTGFIGKRYPLIRNNLHGLFRSVIPDRFIDYDSRVVDTYDLADSITKKFRSLGTGVIPAHEIELVLMGRSADSRLIALMGYYFGINFDSLDDATLINHRGILPSEWKVM